MFIRFFLFLLFALTGVQAQAHQCTEFEGVYPCTHAKLDVTDVSFANAWGGFGPPNLFPTEAAAIADINRSGGRTGYTANGWSEDTPTPAGLTYPPLGVVWTDFDDKGNAWIQTKLIQHLDSQGMPVGAYALYKLRKNNYFCPLNTELISDGMSAKGYPYAMCRSKPIPKKCPLATKNPCSISTGNKFKPQEDWRANIGPLALRRQYNSLGPAFNATLGEPANAAPFGKAWTHNYNMQLIFSNSGNDRKSIVLTRPDGLSILATNQYSDTTIAGAGGWFIDRDASLKLKQLTDGTWQLIHIKNNTVESYDASGRLTKIRYQNGQFVTVAYPATIGSAIAYNPTTVTDNFGKILTFGYNSAGYLTAVTLPTGQLIVYNFDSQNRLSTVARPGYGTKTYLYSESSAVAPSGNLNLLTGIIDEKGVRFESYAYDSKDRGVSTSKAGGVESYTLRYQENTYSASTHTTFVTDPRGILTVYDFNPVSGSLGLASVYTNGEWWNAKRYSYDAAGNTASYNQSGVITNYTYDLTRNLETRRTEAVGTSQERTITTVYHADFPLPTLITESGRTTAYSYDVNGNQTSKIITDTTTNTSRTWTYTYNSVGQKLNETNPAGEKTTYAYDSAGRLLSMTNSLGFVTSYSGYNVLGQPTLITSPNGLTTTYSFDDAGRVLTSTDRVTTAAYASMVLDKSTSLFVRIVNWFFSLLGLSSSTGAPLPNSDSTRSDITTYSYDPIGQLTQVKMPSGETLTYSYDAAHRLIGATDSLGNRISYTLNGAGDITDTVTQDPTGNIKVQTKQIFDNLGRIQQDVGQNGQITRYFYDDFGNLSSTPDALGRNPRSSYDVFNRKLTDVDAIGYSTQYSYNALDQLLTVTDARNNTTTYTPNAFGENTTETSPDTGTTTRTFNQGRLTSVVDSSSTPHTYSYDAAGRVTQRVDGSGATAITTQYGYDTSTAGKGMLSSVKNSDSTINYTRDSLGLVTAKSVTLKNISKLFAIQYKYLAGNKISDIMTPSGRRISYIYTAGKVTSVKVNGATLVSNIRYAPTGISRWTWGTGTDTQIFTTDTDGRITNIRSTGVLDRTYAYDIGNRIRIITDTLAGTGTQTYYHDQIDRLIQQVFDTQIGTQVSRQTLAYGYDANSNRTSKTQTGTGAAAVTTNYVMQASSNRIQTTTTGTGTPYSSMYLPTGQLVADGVKTYGYDSAGRSTTIRNGSNTIYNSYDGLGQRITKVIGGVTTVFVYDESGHLIGEYDQNNVLQREYIWLQDRIIGMYSKDVPNTLLRVHTDHLATPRAVTQGNGSTRKVLWRWEGDAFGDVSPTNPTSTAFTLPIRMAGQYFDSEVGISYNYFRDYDPSVGRYVESDPIGLQGGMNTYGYVGANPLKWIDPKGLQQSLADYCGTGPCTDSQKQVCIKEFEKCTAKLSGWSKTTLTPVVCDQKKKICLKACGNNYDALAEVI
jgi:RHS repeat-associated protein